ncbi:MAG: YkgJ family cysteine cluster protein [Candidatus Rokubacteria bacterium]|nr:YkgJ family cysteine cluster protein [Candidatus Rokubacteria bacterium]
MREHVAKNLLLPDDVVFTCQSCGACCRSDWLIGVDPASHDRLKTIDWARRDPELPPGEKFRKLPLPLLTGEALTFARKPSGECVFLTADTRCSIHRHLGYGEKPQVCREFPYHFVETPDGIAVGLSFACTAVRAHHGKSLPEQRSEILDVLAGSYRVQRVPDPIVLFSGTDIRWEEYRSIETALLDLFHEHDVAFPTALIGGSALISICVGLKRLEARAWREGRAPEETLTGGLEKLADEGYRRLLAIAANVRYPRRGSLTYLAPFYTWLQFSTRRMSRLALVASLYRNYLAFWRGRGRLPGVLAAGDRFEIDAVHRVRFVLDGGEVDGFLREYWAHVIRRKTLTPMHGVFRGYQTLLVLYGFMKWVAKLRAHREGRAETSLEDVKEAVRLVEQRFILHARFAEIFSLSPVLTVMADRSFVQPAFVRGVVLEPR